MSCVAAQDINSNDSNVQNSPADNTPANEILKLETADASKDLQDSENDTVKYSTPANANPDNKLASSNNEMQLGSVIPSGYTFWNISQAIDIAGLGGVVELEEITYISFDGLPIEVFHSVTINGNGAALDARGIPLIFKIHGSDVTIKDITFVNCRDIIDGGAVHWLGNNGKLINCTFTKNKANFDGGAVYWSGDKGNITGCKFVNNTANRNGGAIYLKASNCNIDNCIFMDNNAEEGGAISSKELTIMSRDNTIKNCIFVNNTALMDGGAIWMYSTVVENCSFSYNTVSGNGGAVFFLNKGNVTNCDFNKNNASMDGGAVYFSNNGDLKNCNFLNNHARDGGAIRFQGEGTVINCYFIDNKASRDGGAIYLRRSNCDIDNSTFTNNSALEGGAIYSHGLLLSTKTNKITNSNFTDNNALSGGAIYLREINCDIDNSTFTNNSALEGGAVHCSALLLSTKSNTITNSNFTNNNALICGGAVYLRESNCDIDNSTFTNNFALEGGAIYSHDPALSTKYNAFTNSNFTNNSALNGGAIFSRESNCDINNAIFTNNYAHKGGAIYSHDLLLFTKNGIITNSKFTDNIAKDEGGAIYIMRNNMTIDSDYFNNNVAEKGSAIYKNRANDLVTISNTEFGRNKADILGVISFDDGNETYALSNVTVYTMFVGYNNIANAIWNNGDTTSIQLYNITCEFSKDGKGRSLKKFNENGFANPTEGFEDESKIWQSNIENAQLVDILVTDETGGVVLNITNGVDYTPGKSKNSVSSSDESNLIVTDTDGMISVTLPNLKAGKYSVLVKHEEDEYYTADQDEETFIIYELKVTKTSDKLEYDIYDDVKYTIVVNNTGNSDIGNVTIVENFPEEFYDFYYIDPSLGNNSLWEEGENAFIYKEVLHPHEVVTLVLELFAAQTGENITNSITVSSNITDECIVESNNITVYHPSTHITKTAVNSTVFIGDQAVFIINITNNGNRPLIPEDNVSIFEYYFDELIYDHIVNIKGEWYADEEEGLTLILNSTLDIGESASFEIYFNTTGLGEYDNFISNQYSLELAKDTVTVVKIPTNISIENITAYPGMNVTIQINVTADDNKAFSGNVTIEFPDGSNQTVEVIEGNGNAKWSVPQDYIPGVYNDTVSFLGDDIYLESSGNGIITIESIPTTIIIGDVTVKAGQNVTIDVNVTADNNKPINGNVTVTLPDGTTQTVKVVDGSGKVVWSVPEDYGGNYSVRADYSGNVSYLASNATGTVTVIPKMSINISGSDETAYPDSDVTITINVTTEDGNPFNGEVTVVMPDGSTQIVEIVDGIASATLQVSLFELLAASISATSTGTANWHVPASFATGNYPILIAFNGNDDYFAANGTGNIEVIPIPTHIEVKSNITGTSGHDVTIPINVTSDNDKAFNGIVTVTLPDGSNQTVEIVNGSGDMIWSIPANYNGTYEYTVNYLGNDTYLASNATGLINVIFEKVPVEIIVGNITAEPGDRITIPIKVITPNGFVFNDKVTVILPDETRQVIEITSGEGSVDWTIPGNYDGVFQVKVISNETEIYYPANGTGFITVIPDETPVDNRTVNPDDNGSVTPDKNVKHPIESLANDKTGNPILVLLAVLALMGISIKRKK